MAHCTSAASTGNRCRIEFFPDHTLWEEISGLPPGNEVLAVLPYQAAVGEVAVGLYTQGPRTDGTDGLSVASYDGSGWKTTLLTELPTLVASAQYADGTLPADPGNPSLAAAGITGWSLRGGDRLVGLRVEGAGSPQRIAVVVVAGHARAGWPTPGRPAPGTRGRSRSQPGYDHRRRMVPAGLASP